MKTVKELLKSIVSIDGDYGPTIDMYLIDIKIPSHIDIDGIELENWSIPLIDDNKMILCCGGDWEDPKKLTIEVVDDMLTVTSFEDNVFEEGYSEEELLNILK